MSPVIPRWTVMHDPMTLHYAGRNVDSWYYGRNTISRDAIVVLKPKL